MDDTFAQTASTTWEPAGHAKVVSTSAKDLLEDGNKYREEETLTGDEARVAEVADVGWPRLSDRVNDFPPATPS